MTLKHIAKIYFPFVFLIVLALAFILVLVFEDPLSRLQQFFAQDWYEYSLAGYGLLIALGVVVSSFSVAATIPFAAKILGSGPVFAVVMSAWFVGTSLIFILTRLRPTWISRFTDSETLHEYESKMPAKQNFWSLLVLRLFSPVDTLSYVASRFEKLSYAQYAGATVLGSVPLAFVLSYGAEALGDGNTILFFVFVFLVLLIIAGYLLFEWSYFATPPAKIYTHDSKFHTDDVFAVATVQMVLDQMKQRYKVIRTRDEKILDKAIAQAREGKDVYVVDVGNQYDDRYNLFDHHQKEGAGIRENGIQYASFGLVWKKYGVRLAGNSEVSGRVDRDFVVSIDGPDNGQDLYDKVHDEVSAIPLPEAIEDLYNLHSNEEPDLVYGDFEEAVELAKNLITRMITVCAKREEKQERAGQIYAESENKKIIVTEEHVGRNYFVKYEEVMMIVSPRTKDTAGDWGLVMVPKTFNGLGGRMSFPKSWWGLRDEELQEVTGVSGAKFCHRDGNFLVVANSRKSAEELATMALREWTEVHGD